jgi:cobalt-zinc-cadmium efflux system protein
LCKGVADAHLVRPDDDQVGFLADLADALEQRFGINHATVQVERSEGCARSEHGQRCAPGHRHQD